MRFLHYALAVVAHAAKPVRTPDPSAAERFKRLYAESAECVSRQMLFCAREIVLRDPTAIIVITSDHGSDVHVDWSANIALDGWTQAALEERFGILSAIRAPASCRKWLYDSMSAVNTLRFVTGCLLDEAPVYLPDRSYTASYETHPQFGLVSDQTQRASAH